MIIFVMRHGEAEPYKQDDMSRHLTSFGRTQAEHAAKWMQNGILKNTTLSGVDLALISPYVRTQETAASVSKFLEITSSVSSPMLTPNQEAGSTHDWIDGHLIEQDNISSLLIISHMPLVSLLSDSLCHGFNARIFDTADVLMIDYDKAKHSGRQLSFYQSLT
ncbi:phosphohistidine phosphatase SixA [Glaciecola sp. MH2013]|uniref:phosphohistidine phosphatase SixA n=1 Tax=Glaciecola sp. MH2013 TaxID=2785524 RepID=UPI0018A0736F|nr:phosphohistidine phosphatase SixA [Glaciecola sp. MH2013]MBF7073260.1 phosphohistidine phosphatase SixA [Glaciecola sp. MH2013]